MKFPTSELDYIFRKGEMRRDILALLRYAAFLVGVILLYAALFQLIMVHVEGQSHSWITAVYWTVVTMSTLGVGDVTFTSDPGRLFSLAVLVSGVVLLLVVTAVYVHPLFLRALARSPGTAPGTTSSTLQRQRSTSSSVAMMRLQPVSSRGFGTTGSRATSSSLIPRRPLTW